MPAPIRIVSVDKLALAKGIDLFPEIGIRDSIMKLGRRIDRPGARSGVRDVHRGDGSGGEGSGRSRPFSCRIGVRDSQDGHRTRSWAGLGGNVTPSWIGIATKVCTRFGLFIPSGFEHHIHYGAFGQAVLLDQLGVRQRLPLQK